MIDILKGAWSGLSSLSDVGIALAAFFAEITDYHLWRSLAWLALGVLMMGAGAVLWLKI